MLDVGAVKNSRYVVNKIIGRGGTSCVYLVRDLHIGKLWAMKELKGSKEQSVILAATEIEMLRTINYPMFPKIADAWREDDYFYIISEYVDGICLSNIIGRRGVGKGRAVKWTAEIAEGLMYLHSLSPPILYLDLKPDNILVRPDGSLALIDFGIACRPSSGRMPMGTPGYAAPEQYFDKAGQVDERTDIYALGMTYYSMRTGVITATSSEDIQHAIDRNETLTSREKQFIKKCSEYSPDNRFESVQKLSECLYQIHRNHRKNQRNAAVLGLTAVILLIAVIIFKKIDAKKMQDDAARQMISAANEYIDDGEYTVRGLKVITTFIDSGCLNSDTEQEFIYEVARNMFLVQRDYQEAYRYFNKLDREIFPESVYMLKLCECRMRFDVDAVEMMDCISGLYGSVYRARPSKNKYENILFVSECFEKYDSNDMEGIKKAIAVLEDGVKELNDTQIYAAISETDRSMLREEYMNRIDFLYMKAEKII